MPSNNAHCGTNSAEAEGQGTTEATNQVKSHLEDVKRPVDLADDAAGVLQEAQRVAKPTPSELPRNWRPERLAGN